MNSLSQTRMNILELLWRKGKPIDLREIATEMRLKVRSANMHLIGLRKTGHVSVSEDGCYTLTDLGRDSLGFPKIDSELAKKILSKTPLEKAFNFYVGIGESLGISSDSLIDFCEKIKTIDQNSIEFHTSRGDFELWIHFLGDIELAKRLRLIRESGLSGDALREELYRIIKSRVDELQKIISG